LQTVYQGFSVFFFAKKQRDNFNGNFLTFQLHIAICSLDLLKKVLKYNIWSCSTISVAFLTILFLALTETPKKHYEGFSSSVSIGMVFNDFFLKEILVFLVWGNNVAK
jgi:hypothetical protein